jgi:hypothetical protein
MPIVVLNDMIFTLHSWSMLFNKTLHCIDLGIIFSTPNAMSTSTFTDLPTIMHKYMNPTITFIAMGKRLSSCALVLMQMEYFVDSWTKEVNMVMFAQIPFYPRGICTSLGDPKTSKSPSKCGIFDA